MMVCLNDIGSKSNQALTYPQFHFNAIDFASHQIHNVFPMLEKERLQLINGLERFDFLQKNIQILLVQIHTRQLTTIEVHFSLEEKMFIKLLLSFQKL